MALLLLTCGFGVMLLQPLAIKYGRRLPYLIGSVLILAGLAFGLNMTSINFFFAYMILSGFGSAPSYSTIVTSLLDVAFLHEKGFYLGLYALAIALGNFLPPLAAGYITDSQGWEWCFRYLLIFFGISSLVVMFAAEESSFARKAYTTSQSIISESARHQGPDGAGVSSQSPDAKINADLKPSNGIPSHALSDTTSRPPPLDSRLTYFQKLTLYRPDADIPVGYWRLVFSMFELIVLPAASWVSLQLGISSFVVSLVLTTQASFFSLPPYNFKPSQLGLMYIPLLIGNFFGSFWGGYFTDWMILRLARRNDGVHEPENRLWAYVPLPFVAAGGTLLYGVGADAGLHWTLPCLGLILIGFYLSASLPVALGYALESYPEIEDEIVQLSNFTRNVLGGAVTFCIQPWIDHNGGRNTTIIISVLVLVVNLTSIPFQIWGKTIRVRTTPAYYRLSGKSD